MTKSVKMVEAKRAEDQRPARPEKIGSRVMGMLESMAAPAVRRSAAAGPRGSP